MTQWHFCSITEVWDNVRHLWAYFWLSSSTECYKVYDAGIADGMETANMNTSWNLVDRQAPPYTPLCQKVLCAVRITVVHPTFARNTKCGCSPLRLSTILSSSKVSSRECVRSVDEVALGLITQVATLSKCACWCDLVILNHFGLVTVEWPYCVWTSTFHAQLLPFQSPTPALVVKVCGGQPKAYCLWIGRSIVNFMISALCWMNHP